MPLIPALGSQRQVDLCEFEASLVYKGGSRIARATQRNPVSEKQKNQTGEMAQRLRARAVLLEVLSSIPSNCITIYNVT